LNHRYGQRKANGLKFRSRYSMIGIDLGSYQLKLVQLVQNRGNISLYQRISQPTPRGLIDKGKIKDINAMADLLRQLRGKQGWRTNKVNLCLSPQCFYFSRLTLPPMKASDLKNAMRLEVEKRFSLLPENAVYSFTAARLNLYDKEYEHEYLLVAAAKETANAYTEAAHKAGFKPLALEISPFSLLRVAHFSGASDDDNKGTTLILDLGHHDSTLLLLHNGEFCFYRNLRIGINNFIQSEKENGRYTLFPPDNKGFLNAAGLLTTRLNQSVDYWLEQSEITIEYPRTLQLCGGGVFLKGLPSFLGNRLKLKPKLYTPFAFRCP